MRFFPNETSQVNPLDLLDQLLSQPIINVEQIKKHLSTTFFDQMNYDKNDAEKIFELFKNKLYKIAIHLPERFNPTDAPAAEEEPRAALKKISELLFFCRDFFGGNESSTALLNHVKSLLEVNSKIDTCVIDRRSFFNDLSRIRQSVPTFTPEGLREIAEQRKDANNQAIRIAMELY